MRKSVIGTAIAIALTAAIPAKAANIVEVAKGAGTFGTLLAAAEAAGLAGALADGDNLTVFAPTDEAFAALPEGFTGLVRLFPLPSLVMFPHALQPLHVFEPRYRDMVRDCLRVDGEPEFGQALITHG